MYYLGSPNNVGQDPPLSTGAYSSTSQTPVVHQIEEMRETIKKLNAKLTTKGAKERTLEEKMEYLMKNHEQ